MAYKSYLDHTPAFGVGTRVTVLRQTKYPTEILRGLTGIVKNDSGSTVGVLFDGLRNSRSMYGLFYFKPSDLIAVENNNNEIMEEKNMEKITNYLNIAKVQPEHIPGDRVYQCANFDPGLWVGDLCIVTTDDGAFAVAKVVEVVDKNDAKMSREVVAKVNMVDYNTRIEARAKAAELKAKMEARAKQLQDIALYQMLAKDDPEMAALLQEYQGIPNM